MLRHTAFAAVLLVAAPLAHAESPRFGLDVEYLYDSNASRGLYDADRKADNILSVEGSLTGSTPFGSRGGLVWRAKDPDHYYIARWNPLETNLRLYTVAGGKRSMPMKSVQIDADPKAWHELEVTMVGPRITIRFDGKVVIEAEDATYADGKGVGLWSKADASTRFDSLRIRPARGTDPRK